MKKKLLAFAMVFALAAVAVVGGSLAYFTDTDAKENTFTVGNVKIALIEQQNGDNELVDFENDKQLMPGAENAVDKIVSVENTGGNDAYIRVKITVPSDLAEVIHLVFEDNYTSTWNEVTSETDNSGKVYTAVYKTKIASGDSTSHLLSKVYLDERVDMRLDENNNQEYFYTVTTEEGVKKRLHIICQAIGNRSHEYIRCDRLSQKISRTETGTHGTLRTYTHSIPDIHLWRALTFTDRQTIRRQDQECFCCLGDNIIQTTDPSCHGTSHQRHILLSGNSACHIDQFFYCDTDRNFYRYRFLYQTCHCHKFIYYVFITGDFLINIQNSLHVADNAAYQNGDLTLRYDSSGSLIDENHLVSCRINIR